MKAFRDTMNPLALHTARLDGVTLVFDDEGLLRNPDAAQLEVMTSRPLRTARFVEVEIQAPPPPPPAAAAAEEAPSSRRRASATKAADEPVGEEKPQ
jgi:hypothetical protein